MDEDLIGAADSHDVADGQPSFFDKAADFVTKGIPLSLASGATGVINTGISFGNMLGGDSEKVDLGQNVKDYDDDLGKYYEDHKAGIDLGGFIGTSLIPGTLGVKGLKALQAFSKGEGIGANVGAAAGYFASRQQKYIEAAAETINSETNQLFGLIRTDTLKAIGAGFGEQALQGAAFETGVLLTMNQNPVLEPGDRNYLQNIIYQLPQSGLNAIVFGGVGGLINTAAIRGGIKDLRNTADRELWMYTHADQLGVSELPEGTQAAYKYSVLNDAKDVLNSMKDRTGAPVDTARAGNVNEMPGIDWSIDPRQIAAQEIKVKALNDDFNLHIIQKLVDKDKNELGQILLKNFEDLKLTTENGYPISQNELFARVFGSSNRVTGVMTQVMRNEKEAPNVILQMQGEMKGALLSKVYPAAGDTGKVEMRGVNNEKLYVDGDHIEVPAYDPMVNTPTQSSNRFLIEHSSTQPTPASIDFKDIPALEAAVLNGATADTVKVTNYTRYSENLAEILRESKQNAVYDMKTAGMSDDYISRAINAPRKFVDDPTLNGVNVTLGSTKGRALEDLTQPLYAKIYYTGMGEQARFYAQGMKRVLDHVMISQAVRENVGANIFEDAFQYFPQSTGTLPFTPTISSAAGFTTSANGARNSVMMRAQQVGKMIDKLIREQAEDWHTALSSIREEIRADPAQLYTRNLVATTIRSNWEDMVRLGAEYHPGAVEEKLTLVPRSFIDDVAKNGKADPVGYMQDLISKAERNVVQVPIDSNEAKYLMARQELTSKQAGLWNQVFAARGRSTKFSSDAFYEPPIDTARQPYFALVRNNNPLDDVRPLSVVVAQDAETLNTRMNEIRAKLGDQVDVFTKDDIKTNKQLQGIYDSGLLFNRTATDSSLKSAGILSDYIPRKDDYIFKEEESWIWKQSQAIHRQGVEMTYGTELAELRFLEKQWNSAYSKVGTDAAADVTNNPYTQTINTFLNLSNKNDYKGFWGGLNNAVQDAYSQMTNAYSDALKEAQTGKLTYEEANNIAKSHGYSNAAQKVTEEVFRETFRDPNSLSKLVSKVNLITGTLMIRMDPLNSLINIMSMPVLLGSELKSWQKEMTSKLGLSAQIPGRTEQLPTMMPLLMDGTRAWWNKETITLGGQDVELKQFFKDIGAIRQNIQQVQDSIAIPLGANKTEAGSLAYVNNMAKTFGENASKFTFNNFAEEFVRYQAAYAGLRMGQAQGITETGELASFINLIVNRVHGNYLASQRPSLFSGPVGQAISLFQTYQFNMIQQMTRYIQEGDKVAAVTAMAMQNTLFGMQGNPLFWQLNNYIGNSNSKHRDLVTSIADIAGTTGGTTDPARWILYGLGANSLQINLYNRGDLTPRYTTIVPTNVQDIPAVSIATKAIGSFIDSIKSLTNGAPVADSVLNGIAHAGFNRPFAGLAQLALGGKTTSKGSLLASYNDMYSWSTAAKLMGGEELNNAVYIDAYNRLQAYRTKDADTMSGLSEAVKLTTAGKPDIDPDKTQEFMQKYAEKGGDIKNFNRFMIHATKDSNQSIINKMKQNVANPLTQRQLGWLGADLPDYMNAPKEGEQQ